MMTFIKNELEMAGKTPDCTPEKSKSLDFSTESVFLSGRAEYNAAVEALLKTVNTADNPVVYTNYSYFDAETDKIVYDFAKSKDCRLVIKHSITKGTKDNMKERIHNGFSSIKFAKLGHTTSIAPQDDPPFALSAHFISEKAIVMYDEKSQKGFFSAAETVVKAYYLSAAKRDSEKLSPDMVRGFCWLILTIFAALICLLALPRRLFMIGETFFLTAAKFPRLYIRRIL